MRASPLIGAELHTRVAHLIPFGLLGYDLAIEQAQDDVDRLAHAIALGLSADAEHLCIRIEQTRPDAEHSAAPGLVIELRHTARAHERVVIGGGHHAGAQLDARGALGRGRDEQFG